MINRVLKVLLKPWCVSLLLIVWFILFSSDVTLSGYFNETFFYYFSKTIRLLVPVIFVAYMFCDVYRNIKYRWVLYLTIFTSLAVSYWVVDLQLTYNINGEFCLNKQTSPCQWDNYKLAQQAGLIFMLAIVMQLVMLKVIQLLCSVYTKIVK